LSEVAVPQSLSIDRKTPEP